MLSRAALPTKLAIVAVLIICASCSLVKRSDDTTLQTLVQQQGQTIQTLEAKIAALENKLNSLDTGLQAAAHEKQVAFDVHFNGSWDQTIDVGEHGTLKFDIVMANVGRGFSSQTGVFTAPYSGVYLFILGVMADDATSATQLSIVKSGGQNSVWLAHADLQPIHANGFVRDTVQSAVHLAAGDQVWVEHTSGASSFRRWLWTTFTGVLVQSD